MNKIEQGIANATSEGTLLITVTNTEGLSIADKTFREITGAIESGITPNLVYVIAGETEYRGWYSGISITVNNDYWSLSAIGDQSIYLYGNSLDDYPEYLAD